MTALCLRSRNFEVFERADGLAVRWRLPATKTDPGAISVTREWGCLCSSSSSARCPAHRAQEHFEEMERRFGPREYWAEDLPLFPSAAGGVVEKEMVVRTLEALGARAGMNLRDELGRRALGGHSLRVTGAQYLAAMGVELYKLALLARWSSPIIMRYVGEAPMAGITADARRRLAAQSFESQVEMLWNHAKQKETLDKKRDPMKLALECEAKFVAEVRALRQQVSPPVIQNCDSGVWHRMVPVSPAWSSASQKTLCGWRVGAPAARLTGATELPAGTLEYQRCDRCFPQ